MVAHVGWGGCAWASRLRGDVKVLHGLRVLGLGHLARYVRRALHNRALDVHEAVLGGALLRAVGLDRAANRVHMLPHLLDHAPLLLGVRHLARLLRVKAHLQKRATYVRHVLAARGGVVGELRTAREVVSKVCLSVGWDWVRVQASRHNPCRRGPGRAGHSLRPRETKKTGKRRRQLCARV